MANTQSNAFVFFVATGDLAYKKILRRNSCPLLNRPLKLEANIHSAPAELFLGVATQTLAQLQEDHFAWMHRHRSTANAAVADDVQGGRS